MWKGIVGGLVVLLFFGNVIAKDISVDYPESVEVGEEFGLTIGLLDFPEGDYDVKVEFGERNFAEIYDSSWKSAYYYFKNFVSSGDENELKVRVVEDFEGDKEFSVRVRKNGDSSFTEFGGYEIEINEAEEKVESSEPKVDEISEGVKEGVKVEENVEPKVIYLEPQNIKKDGNSVLYKSSNEKIKNYAIYGFAFFCVVVILLILIKNDR